MIPDSETNLVYLSGVLAQRKDFFTNLISVLNKGRIKFKILPRTKDIWCVDYMPVQKAVNQFIEFQYEPDYLQGEEYILTLTSTRSVCRAIGINTVISDIKIDGGNVIRGKNWVILTDKIYRENKSFDRKHLVYELERLLEVTVIIVPQEPNDIIGHADGMLRYYDDTTVLVNRYRPSDLKQFQRELKTILKEHGLKWIEIPYNPYQNKNYEEADGLYINYLQMEKFVVLPTFDKKEDEQAYNLFEQLFPDHLIETIDSREISKDGGVLNCITWNIKVGE